MDVESLKQLFSYPLLEECFNLTLKTCIQM